MIRRAASMLLLAAGGVPVAVMAQEADWRRVATPPDRDRIRQWRNAWRAALPATRTGGGAAALARDPALFDPDRVTEGAPPPPGAYRCRTFRLGSTRPGGLGFAETPMVRCRMADEGFMVEEGAMRPGGRLYPDTLARSVFLGTIQLADERRRLRYGRDDRRDVSGLLERIGPSRWRLVMPYPRFGSVLDVVEVVPAAGVSGEGGAGDVRAGASPSGGSASR